MRYRRSAAERPRNLLAMRCHEAGPVMLIRSVETMIPNQFAESQEISLPLYISVDIEWAA